MSAPTGPSAPPPNPDGQLLIYRDGGLNLQVRLDGQTVWLTQAAMAELFQTTPLNITMHVATIYEEGELSEEATCKEYLGERQVLIYPPRGWLGRITRSYLGNAGDRSKRASYGFMSCWVMRTPSG